MPRLPKNGVKRQYEVTTIQGKTREMIRLMAMGLGNKEIADIMGVTPQCVSINRNSTLVQERVEELQGARDKEAKRIPEQLEEMCEQALKNVKKILEDPVLMTADPKLVASVSRDVLDRAGFSPVRRISGEMNQNLYLTLDDIRDLKKRHQEIHGEAVEVEAEEVSANA